MKTNTQFEVRDMRTKEKFSMDDEYLNGYAKLCGWKATIVYVSLCRHADNTKQTCFPSIRLISEQHNLSKDTVIDGIKILEKWNIIGKRVEKKRKNGTFKSNLYVLYDKKFWNPKPANQYDHSNTDKVCHQYDHSDQPVRPQLPDQYDHSDTKVSHIKDSHIKDMESLNKLRDEIGRLKKK